MQSKFAKANQIHNSRNLSRYSFLFHESVRNENTFRPVIIRGRKYYKFVDEDHGILCELILVDGCKVIVNKESRQVDTGHFG